MDSNERWYVENYVTGNLDIYTRCPCNVWVGISKEAAKNCHSDGTGKTQDFVTE
jgi:hypothetical protein